MQRKRFVQITGQKNPQSINNYSLLREKVANGKFNPPVDNMFKHFCLAAASIANSAAAGDTTRIFWQVRAQ